MFKRILCLALAVALGCNSVCFGAGLPETTAKSFVLMDGETGRILAENNADERLAPASITKIMTMLLIMEAIDRGEITEQDVVTVSETAAIKTGSHIFLAAGEQMTVEDLLKGIAVASGNDAAIAMGEYLCGTEAKFVEKMNKRARELGMVNTNFVNCNGLDTENHFSSARDVAIMTFELLKHKEILKYTTIWMDTLRNGTFGLANTNKLIRFYEGANGMKTGSTSGAGYCLSATAVRNDLQLVAVVMGAPSTAERFKNGSELLNYGFGVYQADCPVKKGESAGETAVLHGEKDKVGMAYAQDVRYAVEKGKKSSVSVEKTVFEGISAPIYAGQKLGEARFLLDGEVLGSTDILATQDVAGLSFGFVFKEIWRRIAR